MSKERAIPHDFEGEQLESVFVGRRDGQARPTVILIPTVMGVSDLEIGFGRQLVELGYNALVADLFGKEFRGAPRDTMFGEMNRLRSDRAALAPAAAARARARARPRRGAERADRRRRLLLRRQCALDLARSGADIAAAVSFHGLFDPPGLPPREDQGQGRRLPRLGRPDGPARQGRRAGPGADRGRLPTGRSTPTAMSATASPTRTRASCRSTASPTTRSPPSGRGPASSTCSRNCSAEHA